jgi:deoxyribose-phosphate aldolase
MCPRKFLTVSVLPKAALPKSTLQCPANSIKHVENYQNLALQLRPQNFGSRFLHYLAANSKQVVQDSTGLTISPCNLVAKFMDLARYIDSTILKPDTTLAEVKKLCDEAREHHFAAVCVPPFFVKDAAKLLDGAAVKVSSVAGFPMGYAATPAKVEEIKRAIDEGAVEMDCVINLCAVKGKQWNHVRNEMESMATACHMRGKLLKVIFETGLLTEAEISKLCEIAAAAQIDFAKTSTGFGGKGASVGVVELLSKKLPPTVRIKASGGIRDRQLAEKLIAAGADRIGTSAGVAIVNS